MSRGMLTVALAAIVALGGAPALATVSGENGKIVYVTDAEIFVADSDGSNPVRLTNNAVADYDPAWSPDGRTIAFTSMRDGDPAVYTMNLDGSNQKRLTTGADPAWSPDGTQIVFEGGSEVRPGSNPQATFQDLFVVDVASGVSRRLTNAARDSRWSDDWVRSVAYRDPAWSPDGVRLAFIRYVHGPTPIAQGGSLLIATMEDPSRIAAGPFSGIADPDWAPDGRSIVVVDGHPPIFGGQIVRVDLASGVSEPLALPLDPGEFALGAALSPEGADLLALIDYQMTERGLHRMAVDGSSRDLVVEDASQGSWQPVNPYPMGLVNPATGQWHLRDAAGRVKAFYYGNPGDFPFMGDWDCDGIDTPGLYRQSDGYVYLRNSNTQGIADITFYFGNPGDIPIAGDFDDDGCDTVSVYRPSQSRVFIINELGADGGGLGAAEIDYLFGNPGDVPFVGDFDGDGIDTIGLHRPTTGLVYLRNSHTTGIADTQYIYGNAGDRLVANDWNGDGTDSPALFRPSNITHYFRFTNTQGNADAQYLWGRASWLPVTGTYSHG